MFFANRTVRNVKTLETRRRRSFNVLRDLSILGRFAVLLALLTGPAQPLLAAGGRLELVVVDRETGKPIPCRLHLRTQKGRPRKAPKMPFWHDHFVFPGQITLNLPLGAYEFELERGLEYVTRTGYFTIKPHADDSKKVDLHRFVDMAAAGWYCGDLDVHRPARDIKLLMTADDLHVVPLLAAGKGGKPHNADRSPADGPLLRFDGNRFCHLFGRQITRPGGTYSLLNLTGPLALPAGQGEYPPLAKLLEEAHDQSGAWVDATRPYWWDLPTLVALDQIDSIELAHGNMGRRMAIGNENGGKPRDTRLYPGHWGNARWSQQIYFHLLNCGLRIAPSAGSGSGIVPNPVGYNRVYVHVDGELTYEKWWKNLRAGRVVVTNGPLMQPRVHGQLPGYTFMADEGEQVELEIGLTLSIRKPLSYLEIIKNGRVAHSIPFHEYSKSGKLPKVRFDRSGWFLVRAATDVPKTYRYAMTGPYYVSIGYQPRISKRSARFFLDWVYERARQLKLDDPDQQREAIARHRRARDFWQNLVDRANAE